MVNTLNFGWPVQSGNIESDFAVELALQCLSFGVVPGFPSGIDLSGYDNEVVDRLLPHINSSPITGPLVHLATMIQGEINSTSKESADENIFILCHSTELAKHELYPQDAAEGVIITGTRLHLCELIQQNPYPSMTLHYLPAPWLHVNSHSVPASTNVDSNDLLLWTDHSLRMNTATVAAADQEEATRSAIVKVLSTLNDLKAVYVPTSRPQQQGGEEFSGGKSIALLTEATADYYFHPAVSLIAAGIPTMLTQHDGNLEFQDYGCEVFDNTVNGAVIQAKLIRGCRKRMAFAGKDTNSKRSTFLKERQSHFYVYSLLNIMRNASAFDSRSKSLSVKSEVSIMLLKNRQYQRSATVLASLLDHDPGNKQYLANYALCMRRLKRFDEAENIMTQLIREGSGSLLALHTLGNVFLDQNKTSEAIACFERALAVGESPSLHWDLSFALLLEGNYKKAWPHFDHRYRSLGLRHPSADHQRWDGSTVDEQTLLVLDEQGVGDTLQFIRFLDQIPVGEKGRVVFAGKSATLLFVKRIFPSVDVYDWDNKLPPFDCWVGLMSLPAALRTDLSKKIPSPPDISRIEPSRLAFWQKEMTQRQESGQQEKRPVIGICWRGNPEFKGDLERSPGLEVLLPLFQLTGVRFISFQVGPGRDEIHQCGLQDKVEDLGQVIESRGSHILDTVSALSYCDVVISSCTSLVHMLGFTETPGLLMLPYRADWRWMKDRSDSPWYPNLVLFRQHHIGDWQSVVERVANHLQQYYLPEKSPDF